MASNRDIARENTEAYEYCRDYGHSTFMNKAEKCDRYVLGDQWSEKARAALKAKGKPYITVNKTFATFATLAGEQLMRRGDVAFRATHSNYLDTARALDKLWVHFSKAQQLSWHLTRAFWDGVIRSRGFLDLRMQFDENFRGEPVVDYLNSKQVLLYPEDNDFDPDKWTGVIVTKWHSVEDLVNAYGASKSELAIHADKDDTGHEYADWWRDSFGNPMYHHRSHGSDTRRERYRLLRTIERQEWEYKRAEVFIDPTTAEVRQVPEAWGRDEIQLAAAQYGYQVHTRRVKKINWTVSVGDLTLHNKISPYRHFTPIPYFPFLLGGRTSGVVEHLLSPQDLVNKTTSQELQIVAGIANSGWVIQRGKVVNMTAEQLEKRGGADGLVLEVEGPPTEAVDKIKPNQVPTGLDRLGYKAKEFMSEISLVSESMQGLDRADVAAAAIDKKAERGGVSLAPLYFSLDHTQYLVARNWVDLTQAFVSEERIYYISEGGFSQQGEEISVNEEQPDGTFKHDLTVGEYQVTITDVAARDTYDEGQFNQMFSLVKQGAPIAWSRVVAVTSLHNRKEIVQEMEAQEGKNPPSEEEQRRHEAEVALIEAQVADKQGSAEVKGAQAQKAMVEAQKAAAGDGDMQKAALERDKAQQKLAADAFALQQKLQAEQERHDQQLEMEREKAAIQIEKERESLSILAKKAQIEREMLENKLAYEREMAELKVAQQKKQGEKEPQPKGDAKSN